MPTTPLAAREVYQLLRDIAMGERHLRWLDAETIEVDGWVVTLHCDGTALDYCERCLNPEGRLYVFDARQPYRSNPVDLLSTWELAQLQHKLNARDAAPT